MDVMTCKIKLTGRYRRFFLEKFKQTFNCNLSVTKVFFFSKLDIWTEELGGLKAICCRRFTDLKKLVFIKLQRVQLREHFSVRGNYSLTFDYIY